MLTEITLENFKNLVDAKIPLSPFTVLVGANGSGKTSVLEALHLMSKLGTEQPEEERHTFGRVGKILHPISEIKMYCSKSNSNTFLLKISSNQNKTLSVKPLFSDVRHLEEVKVSYNRTDLATVGKSERQAIEKDWLDWIPPSTKLGLDPNRIKEHCYNKDETPVMDESGFGLATVLAFFASTNRELLDIIEADLKRIVPAVQRVNMPLAKIQFTAVDSVMSPITRNKFPIERTQTHIGHRLEVEMSGLGSIPAHLVSEGTLITLGILTVLHTNTDIQLLLIDDIDRGLHPKAQKELVECLRKVQETKPDLQIVATSHSPYMLDLFEPNEICVMALDDKGFGSGRRLSDHPDWEEWKGHLKAGEFWSHVGEDWVTQKPEGAA